MTSICADSITMSFGARRVLAGVYLEAGAGDIVGILGRNGSGKSTLYKWLLGMHRSSSGSVRIDGRRISRSEAPRCYAYLPQDSYLPLDLPLWKSASLILGSSGDHSLLEQDGRAATLMSRRARRLSGGEVRYVECLLALSLDRPVILLDEPFSQIEPILCETLERYIRAAAIGRVVMLSDHLYQNVQKLASFIEVLENGTLWKTRNDIASLRRYGYLTSEEP